MRVVRRVSLALLAMATLAGSAAASHAPDCFNRHPEIVGTSGNDNLNGTSGSDVIHGVGGSDTIQGFSGDDTICGGEGNDDVEAGGGTTLLMEAQVVTSFWAKTVSMGSTVAMGRISRMEAPAMTS